ncbi:DUF3631 domain-containing protein [Georgenia sp. AZ-5]|uniref:DUF3631 domain-containing protein n=1 Tax=Georgenia sp. AZ-5 TaxID=3367526 RepID=UPI003754EF26
MSAPQVPLLPGPRAGAELLNRVRSVFARYTVQSSDHALTALSLYALYTHAAHAFDFAPRLLLTSAEKRSGKSRTLEVLGALSRAPLVAANATVPAIFRSIDPDKPRTLIFDEADTIFGTKIKAEMNEDLRGLINAGFQRGTPVLRTVGPNHVPTEFATFAPVVMAAIGTLPDTIVDRAVNIRLRRRKPSEVVAPFRAGRHAPELHQLRDELALWAGAHLAVLRDLEPESPLEDRAADLWEPLLAVADTAGGSWPSRARQAAVALVAQAADADGDHSLGAELLRDIQIVLEGTAREFIQTSALLERLRELEDSRWGEEGLSGRRLADLLKPYGVTPGRDSSGNARGYRLSVFADVFERYLTAAASQAAEATESFAPRLPEPVAST